MKGLTRRSFIDWLLGLGVVGWLSSVLYPVIQYIIPPRVPEARLSAVKVGKVDDFELNSGRIVRFGQQPVLLIRTEFGDFKAFGATCTHLACIVQYRPDWKLIWCACHNGRFDLNGINIAGPPPRPLEPLKVVVRGDDVYVTREA